MRGEKTKAPGKEFAAQVSDYIPSPRRKTKPEQAEPPSRVNSAPDQSARSTKKPDRPWSLSSPSIFVAPETLGETGHKLSTNWTQTGYKLDTEPDTNQSQTGHSDLQEAKRIPTTGHKLDTQPDTLWDTNRTQTEHKLDTDLLFTQLVGLQRKILIFIYRACQIARSRMTDPLALEHVARSLNILTGSVKTTLRRLEEKGCIRRIDFKNGRGGWSKYELPDHVFSAMLQFETEHKLDTKWTQSEHKLGTQPDTQPDTSPPSSSSSLDIDLNKLTNTAVSDLSGDLPPDWNEIDPSALCPIRFGRPQLVQLIRVGNLTADQVQESINAFAFDLEVNGKGREINGHALNYFMGILRKGPYAPSANYEAPEIRQMRLYLEAKELEKKVRLDLEGRLENAEFEEWIAALTVDERTQVVPTTDFAKPGSQGHNAQLKQYFRENIWPSCRVKALKTQDRGTNQER